VDQRNPRGFYLSLRRREFIAAVGGICWSVASSAQQKSLPVIGYFTATVLISDLIDEFRKGLAQQGYVEGKNLAIEFRAAEGEYDRLATFAADFARRHVDVIVASGGTVSAREAKAATSAIPIVFLGGGDPVTLGLVDSLAHPGGNVTGVAQLSTASDAKRLQLLHELVPTIGTIGYLENPKAHQPGVEDAAHAIGVKLSIFRASTESELTTAFSAMMQEGIGALLLSADPYFFVRREQIVDLSLKYRILTMYFFRQFVTVGGLISYGTSLRDGYLQIGIYAGRVLNGDRPAELPVIQQSEKIELVINLRAAKALGLIVPQSVLARADEVIE
jgi:putative ABC transport system substrate-binding protein